MSFPHSKSSAASPLSLSEQLHQAVPQIETAPAEALVQLLRVQSEVRRRALLSSNESLDDIATSTLDFLALEHYLALAYLQQPTDPSRMTQRLQHVRHSVDLWTAFFQRLDDIEALSKEERKQYEELLEVSSDMMNDESQQQASTPPLSLSNREDKVTRFRHKQAAQQERARLQALNERRQRLGMSSEEDVDGLDEESLSRALASQSLALHKLEALEEWTNALRELPMIQMMIQRQQEQPAQPIKNNNESADPRERQRPDAKPMQLTHITQSSTGQLQIRKEELQSQVFRPGWNQPTMSLEELAEREVSQAIEREAQQALAEEARKLQPQRYEQLQKDGLEDQADLVDASAQLDRQWDDWKDENPKGSGNKRGNVGDRNF